MVLPARAGGASTFPNREELGDHRGSLSTCFHLQFHAFVMELPDQLHEFRSGDVC